jgi:hypothetical protein
MVEQDAARIGEALWSAIEAGRWDEAASLTHDDFVQEWPQSGERIVGRENALAVNRNFPGGVPRMVFRSSLSSGDLAVVHVDLTYADGSVYQAVAVIRVKDEKVWRETDYFAEPFPAPQWRAQWVERT